MEYHVKKPGTWGWTPIITGSLAAEVAAGRVGQDWRLKGDESRPDGTVGAFLDTLRKGVEPLSSPRLPPIASISAAAGQGSPTDDRRKKNGAAIGILYVVSVAFAIFFVIGYLYAEANPDFFGRTQIGPKAWVCALIAVLAFIVALVWTVSSREPTLPTSGGSVPATPPGDDTKQRLKTLSDLLAEGNISEEEYHSKRRDILSQL